MKRYKASRSYASDAAAVGLEVRLPARNAYDRSFDLAIDIHMMHILLESCNIADIES